MGTNESNLHSAEDCVALSQKLCLAFAEYYKQHIDTFDEFYIPEDIEDIDNIDEKLLVWNNFLKEYKL